MVLCIYYLILLLQLLLITAVTATQVLLNSVIAVVVVIVILIAVIIRLLLFLLEVEFCTFFMSLFQVKNIRNMTWLRDRRGRNASLLRNRGDAPRPRLWREAGISHADPCTRNHILRTLFSAGMGLVFCAVWMYV